MSNEYERFSNVELLEEYSNKIRYIEAKYSLIPIGRRKENETLNALYTELLRRLEKRMQK